MCRPLFVYVYKGQERLQTKLCEKFDWPSKNPTLDNQHKYNDTFTRICFKSHNTKYILVIYRYVYIENMWYII